MKMAKNEYAPFNIDLNLEDVQEWGGEERPLLPIGTYHFEVVNVSNEGKFIKVEFKVLEGPQVDGRAWNNYMTGTKPGQARLKSLMIACGASLQRFNSDELLGAYIYADVIHQVGNARVDEMGVPLPAKTFANVQNERKELAEGEITGPADDQAGDQAGGDQVGGDPTPDLEQPPITRSATPAPAPAPEPAKPVEPAKPAEPAKSAARSRRA